MLLCEHLTKTVDQKLDTVIENQKKLKELFVAKSDEILAELAEAKKNLDETQGDLDELVALGKTQSENVTALEKAIEDLKAQVGDSSALDAILAAAKDIKETSRKAADVVDEVPEEPPTDARR